jgi:hypothetical protein
MPAPMGCKARSTMQKSEHDAPPASKGWYAAHVKPVCDDDPSSPFGKEDGCLQI